MQSNGRTNGSSGVLGRTKEEARFFWSDIAAVREDLGELAAKEIELFQAEFAQQRTRALNAAIFGVLALVAALLFAAFLATTLMFVLDTAMATWLAAFITSLVLAALAGAAGYLAYEQLRRITIVPKRTLNSLREDREWLANLMSSKNR